MTVLQMLSAMKSGDEHQFGKVMVARVGDTMMIKTPVNSRECVIKDIYTLMGIEHTIGVYKRNETYETLSEADTVNTMSLDDLIDVCDKTAQSAMDKLVDDGDINYFGCGQEYFDTVMPGDPPTIYEEEAGGGNI